MSPDAFKSKLAERGERYVFEAIISQAKPVIFAARVDYDQWRDQLAAAGRVKGSENVALVGSALIGFSMAPPKFGRPFSAAATQTRPASDLDTSVIDAELFDECWSNIVAEDRRFALRLSSDEKDKLMQDVYYGFISGKL